MSPTGYPHGIAEAKIAHTLSLFVDQHKLGHVLVGEVGIYIRRNPDTIRGADVIYISAERLSQAKSKSYLDVAPELVVEVLSPGDRWSDVTDKIDEYFSIGVQVVWIADPRQRQIFEYRSPTQVKRFKADETLSGGDILPGFEISVATLFET
ncbi:Uma2 family endonuclease [Desulfonema magnum]|nr:Uma2 family endonuclease [Desulfonema magnum]